MILWFYDPFLRSEFVCSFPCRVKITILTSLIRPFKLFHIHNLTTSIVRVQWRDEVAQASGVIRQNSLTIYSLWFYPHCSTKLSCLMEKSQEIKMFIMVINSSQNGSLTNSTPIDSYFFIVIYFTWNNLWNWIYFFFNFILFYFFIYKIWSLFFLLLFFILNNLWN